VTIDEFLARALLRDHPRTRPDVVPVPRHESAAAGGDDQLPWPVPHETGIRYGAHHDVTHDLNALCETVVTHTAVPSLQKFLTDRLPEPCGALVMGCILQLKDDDGSRLWWQYAAGAGDDVATYCLYLHHLALGEADAAWWWREQMHTDPQPPQPEPPADQVLTLPDGSELPPTDTSVATVLRVLRRLLNRPDISPRPRTEAVDAVMSFIPQDVAIGYLDNTDADLDLPLPGPYFAERLTCLLAAAALDDTLDETSAGIAPSPARATGTDHLDHRSGSLPGSAPHPHPAQSLQARQGEVTPGAFRWN
jgi:hypothetical protein